MGSPGDEYSPELASGMTGWFATKNSSGPSGTARCTLHDVFVRLVVLEWGKTC